MPKGKHPNSLKNLEKRKPFVKGDSRINPGGKVKSFEDLRKYFQEIANENVDGETRIRRIAEMMANHPKLMKTFLEFAYGKVPLKLEGELSGDLVIRHVYDDEPRVTNSSPEELPSESDGSDSKSS